MVTQKGKPDIGRFFKGHQDLDDRLMGALISGVLNHLMRIRLYSHKDRGQRLTRLEIVLLHHDVQPGLCTVFRWNVHIAKSLDIGITWSRLSSSLSPSIPTRTNTPSLNPQVNLRSSPCTVPPIIVRPAAFIPLASLGPTPFPTTIKLQASPLRSPPRILPCLVKEAQLSHPNTISE